MTELFYCRYRRAICLAALLVLPLLGYGSLRAYLTNSNDIKDWMPRHIEGLDELIWFFHRFGTEEILVVSWPGCTLEDQRLEAFAHQLRQSRLTTAGQSSPRLFRQVFTGRETLSALMDGPAGLERDQALDRMQGWLVGHDGQTTCVVALVSHVGMENREQAVRAAYTVANNLGFDRDKFFVGGSTVDSVAIDAASQQYLLWMGTMSGVWGLLAAWRSLRSFRMIVIVFLTAVWAWTASLTVLFLSGTNMNAVMMMMPVLVYVLGVSGAIHLANYYLDAVRHQGVDGALRRAMRRGWLPVTLASVTTSFGLGSLMVSEVIPIRRFGLFSSIGVMIVLGVLLLLWPAAMSWWMRPADAEHAAGLQTKGRRGGGDPWWFGLCRLSSSRYGTGLLLVVLLLLPLFLLGISRIRTSTKLNDLMPPTSDLMRSYAWLQQHIGPLVPMEVVLNLGPRGEDDARELLRRIETVERLRERIDRLDHVGGTLAASTFVPALPAAGGARQIMHRRVAARRIQRQQEDFQQLGYLYLDGPQKNELWRISARLSTDEKVEYGKFLQRLDGVVAKFLEEEQETTGLQATAVVTGGVPLIYTAQKQLLEDLIRSFVTAFLLIGLVMMLITRSLIAGMVSMVPNIFPAAVVFGSLGLCGQAIDIGVMMTASAAMGIAVDDTIHFLVSFRRGLARYGCRSKAVESAYQQCASAMLQTTLICGGGLLFFAFSPFLPIERFAWFMFLLLVMALLGDLLVFPALLNTPVGRFFARHRPDPQSLAPQEAVSQASQATPLTIPWEDPVR
ncbi:MAG: MMPL family transporter [Planctomycetales bacterium]|nr:MMPL family transporter [Planctomycetales bacterium]NIM09042.1 MMPL family transporter [Planctomycetales bacterium]NIN08505.1 MMPL family transporter [Planctomycetales bacterium]NIN77639.1 MMPL family transporter [Planctomycetales bacterium]NIO34802.1 MMPL family transporter [Planctomycetales bacterium]